MVPGMKRAFWVVLFIGFHLSAVASAREQICSSGLGASWCIDRSSSDPTETVVYYLHGNGGSEKSWATAEHDRLVQFWQSAKGSFPTVVTISFGTNWFLNNERQSLLVSNVIPFIERTMGINPQRRVLFGESMGGFNAAVLFKKRPKFFAKVAIVCPALYSLSPFAETAAIDKEAESLPPAGRKFFYKWLSRQASAFRTEAEWTENNPLNVSETVRGRTVFLLGDGKDSLGFFEGANLLRSKFLQQGVRLKWWLIPQGDHCQHSEESLLDLAKFLSTP